MNQTFFIYTLIVGLPTLCSLLYFKIYGQSATIKISNVLFFFPIIIISLIYGMRYDVGTDWQNYVDIFYSSGQMSYLDIFTFTSKIEPLYLLFNKIVFDVFGSPIYMFGIAAICQLLLIFKGIASIDLSAKTLLLFTFLVGGYVLMMLNIQRQTIAIAIFIYSIQFINKRSFFKYVSLSIIAVGFHYSAILIIPMYFIYSKYLNVLNSKMLLLLFYIISFFLGSVLIELIQYVLSNFDGKYGATAFKLGENESTISSGLGVIYKMCFNILTILFSSKLLRFYERTNFIIIFRIYCLGIFLTNIVGFDSYLIRLPYYYLSLQFIVLSFFVYYLWNVKTVNSIVAKMLAIILITANTLLFYVSIYNGSNGSNPFNF